MSVFVVIGSVRSFSFEVEISRGKSVSLNDLALANVMKITNATQITNFTFIMLKRLFVTHKFRIFFLFRIPITFDFLLRLYNNRCRNGTNLLCRFLYNFLGLLRLICKVTKYHFRSSLRSRKEKIVSHYHLDASIDLCTV